MQIVTAAEPSLSAEEHAGHAHPPGKHDAAEAGHDHEGGILGPNTELIFALACGGLLASGYLIERFLAAPGWLPFAFYLSAYAFGGFFTLREAIDNLRLKRFEIDTLMLVAAGGAADLRRWRTTGTPSADLRSTGRVSHCPARPGSSRLPDLHADRHRQSGRFLSAAFLSGS